MSLTSCYSTKLITSLVLIAKGTFEKLPTSVSGDALFVGHQILSHDIPQYFQYERTKELELWEIRRAN